MDPKEAWKTCWAVNSVFAVKPKNGRFLACVICKNELYPDRYYSSFLADAIEWPCGHMLSGYLCTKCDEALVLSVSKGEVICQHQDCNATLGVNFEVIEARLHANPQLFERYRTLASFECVGCLELQPRGGKPLTTRCKHERNLCKDCASRMVNSAVTSGGWDSLKCPVRECKAELKYEDVRKVAAKVDFDRYDELVTQRLIKKDPNYAQCNRPGGDCTWGQIHEGGTENARMACQKCGFLSCFSCTAAWHEGQTCREYHNLVATDPESEEHKRKYCKRCPGAGCGEYTKKAGACQEMSCPNIRCARNWCWYCKVILDFKRESYTDRAANQHLTTCTAPTVVTTRQRLGTQGIAMPSYSDTQYRPGWNMDEGFIGTGEEED